MNEDSTVKKKIIDKKKNEIQIIPLEFENNDTISTTKQESKVVCPYCHSDKVYGISRVVGYYSIIDNWNKSKKAELKRRQKGNYWPSE